MSRRAGTARRPARANPPPVVLLRDLEASIARCGTAILTVHVGAFFRGEAPATLQERYYRGRAALCSAIRWLEAEAARLEHELKELTAEQQRKWNDQLQRNPPAAVLVTHPMLNEEGLTSYIQRVHGRERLT